MTLAGKRRAVFALLVLLAAWPLVHHELVRRLELNPWKFFGWAMYCTPPRFASIELVERIGSARRPLDASRLGPAVEAELAAFHRTYLNLGRLARPDRLARAAFRSAPALGELEIVVRDLALDRATARFEEKIRAFAYARGRARGAQSDGEAAGRSQTTR